MLSPLSAPPIDQLARDVGGLPPGDVDHRCVRQLAHPRQLAARVVARPALHPLDVPGEQLLEPQRPARRGRGVGGGRQDLLARAGRNHRLHARVDPPVQRVAIHHQPGEQRRHAGARGPQLVVAVAIASSPISSSSSARTIRWLSVGAIASAAQGARRASSAWSSRGPRSRIRRAQRSRTAGVRWRAQLELGQRRPQVQPGAADDDRPPAVGERAVDLGVRQLRVAAGAERLPGRHEADQPVLEPCPLLRCRRPGQDLQPAVDLQGVGGDGEGPLAELAQPVGERDRDLGLADSRRAEQGDHGGSGHRAQYRRTMVRTRTR